MKRTIYKILLVTICFTVFGCIKIGYSKNQVDKSIERAEKAQTKVEKAVQPPVKPWTLIKSEMDILAYIKKDLAAADSAMTHTELVAALAQIRDKIEVLQSSVGLSPENTKKLSKSTIERRISKIRRLIANHKSQEYEYRQRMRDFQLNVSSLQDIVKEKDSIISQLWTWLIILIVISVVIAAFVPGGGMLVSRFWSGAFKTAHIFGEKAYDTLSKSVKGLNNAMDKNPDFDKCPEGSRRTYREILMDEIQQELGDEDKVLFHDVQNGKDKIRQLREQMGKHLKKVGLK